MSPVDGALAALLPPPGGETVPCKICGQPAPTFGQVSFLRATGRPDPDPHRRAPQVQHQRCTSCGLLFTAAFDRWAPEHFEAHIYNDGYVELDPDYVERRPLQMAQQIARMFTAARGEIRLLDYGGGSGLMAQALRRAGFSCETYDPFSRDHRGRPAGRFNLISCIETVEHLPHPMETLSDLVQFADARAAILFTTLLQPADILQRGLDWWYVGPRNGHLTFHTARSLELMWKRLGFTCVSLSEGAHLAVRQAPDFVLPLLKAAAQPAPG